MNIKDLETRVKALELLKEQYRESDGVKWRIAQNALEYWEAQLDYALVEKANKEFRDELNNLEIQLQIGDNHAKGN